MDFSQDTHLISHLPQLLDVIQEASLVTADIPEIAARHARQLRARAPANREERLRQRAFKNLTRTAKVPRRSPLAASPWPIVCKTGQALAALRRAGQAWPSTQCQCSACLPGVLLQIQVFTPSSQFRSSELLADQPMSQGELERDGTLRSPVH